MSLFQNIFQNISVKNTSVEASTTVKQSAALNRERSLTRSLPRTQRLRRAAAIAGDGLNKTESKLADQINQYRQANGLPTIRLSKALSTVANRHVVDLVQTGTQNLHSWSDAPYDSGNPATYPSMWSAPQRLNTGYPGNGYEIAFWTSSNNAKAGEALNGWKNSPGHNTVILNQGMWGNVTWKAMGVGIKKGYAVVWFGEQRDRTGLPDLE